METTTSQRLSTRLQPSDRTSSTVQTQISLTMRTISGTSSRGKFSDRKLTEVMCKHCLHVFQAGREDTQYCTKTSKCRVAAHRERLKGKKISKHPLLSVT